MKFQIITFYKFKNLTDLQQIRQSLFEAMEKHAIFGTFIIADEGFNSTVCGRPGDISRFVEVVSEIFETEFDFKSSFHDEPAFRRRKVKIKREIVTLKKMVDIGLGTGTHVGVERWNELVGDPSVIVLDARNDYEHQVGTFRGAVNPKTESFKELPEFVENNFSPDVRIAMFCTGGIRCEKFAPYLKGRGFREVYQLEGGILQYLENVQENESLWEGECFVFDERVTVDQKVKKGTAADFSAKKTISAKLDVP